MRRRSDGSQCLAFDQFSTDESGAKIPIKFSPVDARRQNFGTVVTPEGSVVVNKDGSGEDTSVATVEEINTSVDDDIVGTVGFIVVVVVVVIVVVAVVVFIVVVVLVVAVVVVVILKIGVAECNIVCNLVGVAVGVDDTVGVGISVSNDDAVDVFIWIDICVTVDDDNDDVGILVDLLPENLTFLFPVHVGYDLFPPRAVKSIS